MATDLVVAVLAGVLQGLLEWLPVSSEGNVSLVVTALTGASPERAVKLSLFLHLGTGLAATVYYRMDVRALLDTVTEWRPRTAFAAPTADVSFIGVATLASGVVGLVVYAGLEAVLSQSETAPFVALVGGLLVLTGLLQRTSASVADASQRVPRATDAVLVGVGQGLALLPGVSRSGTTTSLLLLRGYDEEAAFRLSFLLAIPASIAAAVLVVLDTGGIPSFRLTPATLALATSLVVGYATISALLRFVQRVSFWAVCVVFGVLMLAGAALL